MNGPSIYARPIVQALVGAGFKPARVVAVWFAVFACAPPNEEPEPTVSTLVDGVVDIAFGRAFWVGARVPVQQPMLRPSLSFFAHDALAPACVHFDSPVEEARAQELLSGAAKAWRELSPLFPVAPFDGGEGGGLDLDLYLVRSESLPNLAEISAPNFSLGVESNAVVGELFSSWSQASLREASVRARQQDGIQVGFESALFRDELDHAHTFAVIAAGDRINLEYTGYVAFASAWIHGLDPAESQDVVQGLARYFANAGFGRDSAPLDSAMPTLLTPPDMAGFLRQISVRHDHGSGRFLRDAFLSQRQASASHVFHRATPTTFTALARLLALANDSLDGELRAQHETLAAHMSRSACSEVLPQNYVTDTLEVSGVDARCFARNQAQTSMEVWLRGEYLARWALSVMLLDARGNVLQTLRAPVRNEPAAYLPVSFSADTASVAFVVSQLGEAPNRQVSDYWRYRYSTLPVQDGDVRAALHTPPPYIPEIERTYSYSNRVAAARVTVRLR